MKYTKTTEILIEVERFRITKKRQTRKRSAPPNTTGDTPGEAPRGASRTAANDIFFDKHLRSV